MNRNSMRVLSAILTISITTLAVYIYRRLRFRPSQILVANGRLDLETNVGLSITRYNGNASNDAPPLREIKTNNPKTLALDSDNNIYVGCFPGNQVLVYPWLAWGQAGSIRNIQGTNTMLWSPNGLAVDAAGNLYVADLGNSSTIKSSIIVFAPRVTGDIAPIAQIPSFITPPNEPPVVNTQLQKASGVAVDHSGYIYVADSLGQALLVFAPGSNGDVAPVVVVSAGLGTPQQVALEYNDDLSVKNIYVTDGGLDAIVVFEGNLNANSTPSRTITSADLHDPRGIAIDDFGRIYVAVPSVDCVLVFETGATGASIPVRKIQGPQTRLKSPQAVAVRKL